MKKTTKDIADKVKTLFPWPYYKHEQPCRCAGCIECNTLLEAIRALDGKTVLPVEITQVIEDGDTLCVENGMDGGHCVGIVVASLVAGGEVASANTIEAAIDALAEELRKGKP